MCATSCWTVHSGNATPRYGWGWRQSPPPEERERVGAREVPNRDSGPVTALYVESQRSLRVLILFDYNKSGHDGNNLVRLVD